jgi:AraC-like DNA-binding protein
MASSAPKSSSLTDRQIFGSATRQSIVRADPRDPRPWLHQGAVCTLLSQHHIGHVGIMRAAPPYEVVRTEQSGTFMLACFEGEGVVLVDGAWKKIRKGQACLLPPFVTNALKCLPGKLWKFAWVRYDESPEAKPIISSVSPVSAPFDPLPLKFAIEGLHAEVSGNPSSSASHHWTELIHHYVLRFAQPTNPDDRLWRVWQKVEADLKKPWTLGDLAAIAYVSEEHLRRLCRKELGRSPVQHLTFLRLQRARHLLATTPDKIESIANDVGFKSMFGFSNTFKSWIGVRPSEFRKNPVT